jgi:glutathione S-transferase
MHGLEPTRRPASPVHHQLVGEDFSPWTEKARWALDHHGHRYHFRQYQPLVDEPWLRLKTANLTRKATVPVLFASGQVFDDSFAIARWAEQHGRGTPLFPADPHDTIARWNARSERALRAGRALFFTRLSHDRDAQLDHLPAAIPTRLRPLLVPGVRVGIAYLRAKHGVNAAAIDRATNELTQELAGVRKSLTPGRRYLLGSFSYADITMCVVCQFVRPVADDGMPLTPANRRCWTHQSLAEDFADVIQWRDEVYSRHRHEFTPP